MKQAHDEILEKWLEDEFKRHSLHRTNTVDWFDGYYRGYVAAIRTFQDKLEELWGEK